MDAKALSRIALVSLCTWHRLANKHNNSPIFFRVSTSSMSSPEGGRASPRAGEGVRRAGLSAARRRGVLGDRSSRWGSAGLMLRWRWRRGVLGLRFRPRYLRGVLGLRSRRRGVDGLR